MHFLSELETMTISINMVVYRECFWHSSTITNFMATAKNKDANVIIKITTVSKIIIQICRNERMSIESGRNLSELIILNSNYQFNNISHKIFPAFKILY